jgi:hypothetical protein
MTHKHVAVPKTYYPAPVAAYPRTTYVSAMVPRAGLVTGVAGAMVGGISEAAKGIRHVKKGEITREQAVRNTFKEAAGAGVATATATVVVGALGATGILGLMALFATATGVKYAWNTAVAPVKK